MNRIGRSGLLGLGVVFTILGLFLFGIAYSSYQDSNTNYQTCLKQGFFVTYCNSNTPVILWGVPLEIIGGTLTAIGLGLIVVPVLGKLESRKLIPPSAS
jgi:hypothetical protein